ARPAKSPPPARAARARTKLGGGGPLAGGPPHAPPPPLPVCTVDDCGRLTFPATFLSFASSITSEAEPKSGSTQKVRPFLCLFVVHATPRHRPPSPGCPVRCGVEWCSSPSSILLGDAWPPPAGPPERDAAPYRA